MVTLQLYRARTNIQSFIRDMGKEDKYVTKESAEEEEQNLPEVSVSRFKIIIWYRVLNINIPYNNNRLGNWRDSGS